ncbi:hypothetical protein [Botrytis cinerea negative-stranded RNA virus 4]|uniref:Uncharacterized protein n=1 Tax=Botrytis cinerea negative-stranded RNA virus 4 TaxID=2735939 RepID=A0AAE7DTM3_9MONO|nr:hypothetical protein QKS22_gp4 [Botrytis cinerea negative-stranded RNA virus 4]QJW39407.1 hypothetical protein [Botrytis cinerea negative-stranded RNA virus 4]
MANFGTKQDIEEYSLSEELMNELNDEQNIQDAIAIASGARQSTSTVDIRENVPSDDQVYADPSIPNQQSDVPVHKKTSRSPSAEDHHKAVVASMKQEGALGDVFEKSLASDLALTKMRLSKLEDHSRLQADTINRLLAKLEEQEQRTRSLDSIVAQFGPNFNDVIMATKNDLQKRIDETIEIHKDTPLLIEKLVSACNNVVSVLPSDVKSGLQEVQLNAKEKKTLSDIRSKAPATKTKRLPPHLR